MKDRKIMSESISRVSIPDEVVQYTILPLLSSKCLLRFTCVCKSWNSLIRDPSFINRHRFIFVSHDLQSSTVQFQVFSAPYHAVPQTLKRPTLIFSLPNLNFFPIRVQCVNGLLCIHPARQNCLSSPDSAFTLIANPTTAHVIPLPIDHSIDHSIDDPTFKISTHFGYDPARDQFKVLRLVEYESSLEFKVFTLGARDNSWRIITPPPTKAYFIFFNRGLYVNGAIYWKLPVWEIVSFDVATESFSFIPIPERYHSMAGNFRTSLFLDLVEVRGCLCLISYGESDFKLWMLKDYQNQVWEIHSILLPYQIEHMSKEKIVFPFCQVPTGEILLLPYFLPLPKHLIGIYYDLDKVSARKVVVMEMPKFLRPNADFDIFFCKESFRLLE